MDSKMRADLENRFTYHAPKNGQTAKYEALRAMGLEMAVLIVDLCPAGREQALALTHTEEVVFWSVSAIARHE